MTLDAAALRDRFPALATPGPDGARMVFADAPGGTQAVDTAIDEMAGHLRRGTANHGGPFAGSSELDELCDRVRGQVGRFVGSPPEGVVFGPNMTTLTLHLSHALDARLGPDDEIVCTQLDHDANVAPWLALGARTGATVRWVELDTATGTLDLCSLERAVSDRTALVTFPGASNALGSIVDPAPFVTAARSVGALTFMDAVHAAPHIRLDRVGLGVDVLACSPYKFFGPHSGLLAADPGLLASLAPDKVRPAPDRGPDRWQTGTADFESIAGIGGALSYLDQVGMEAIREHEVGLSRRFLEGLRDLDHVTLHGPADPARRTPTFAVTVAGMTPQEVATELAVAGIRTYAGHYYAVEPMRALGLLDRGGAVRIGFVHYHDVADVDRVVAALAALDGRG